MRNTAKMVNIKVSEFPMRKTHLYILIDYEFDLFTLSIT